MIYYEKDGKRITEAGPIEVGNNVVFNPTANQFAENGWAVYVPPVPPLPTVYTKLQIRRAMRELGIENKLDALLASDETVSNDWRDAQDIDLADPVLLSALAAGQITADEVRAIINKINNITTTR